MAIAAQFCAGNVSLAAKRFGADNGRVARAIWCTLITVSIFSVAGVARYDVAVILQRMLHDQTSSLACIAPVFW